MDLSIIIVSYKVKGLLKKCLESIQSARGGLSLEVFVVDNESGDGTDEMVRHDFGWVKFIAAGGNLGFARANNLALARAAGEYVLFLNPDTEVASDTFARALELIKSRPKCGVLGPKMAFSDGSFQPSVRRFPTFAAISLMLLKLPKIFPHLAPIDRYLATDFDYSQEQPVDQVMGAFMLMPRAVLDKVGGFDERFFIWFEEVDLCRRVKSAGYSVIYTPEVSIIHHGGKSFAQQSLVTNQRRFFVSAFKYFVKYGFSSR